MTMHKSDTVIMLSFFSSFPFILLSFSPSFILSLFTSFSISLLIFFLISFNIVRTVYIISITMDICRRMIWSQWYRLKFCSSLKVECSSYPPNSHAEIGTDRKKKYVACYCWQSNILLFQVAPWAIWWFHIKLVQVGWLENVNESVWR